MPTLIDDSIGTLGETKWSRLTQTQFQALYGVGWVLYDGRGITGSPLANLLSITSLEDFRALFPRAGNNGRSDSLANPDGDQVAGTTVPDRFEDHVHQFQVVGNPSSGNACAGSTPVIGNRNTSGAVSGSPGAETSGKAGILNCFIRIA